MSDMAGIAGNAVLVYQQALTTLSNNIANVSTEGYSRQDVKLNALPVTLVGNVFLGSGVNVERIQRQYDAFVEGNLRNTASDLASQEPMVNYTNRVVDIMGGQTVGLSTALDQFFLAARSLSGDASSSIMRSNFLREAEGVTERFSQLSAQLDLVDIETQQSVDSAVGQINILAADIALVNKQLTKQRLESAQPADLLDQRDLLLKKLANFAHVNTKFTANGTVTVSLGATITQDVLVEGNLAHEVAANYSASAPEKVALVLDPYGKSRNLSGITSGTLAGLMSFREQVLGSTRNALNGMAKTFVSATNSVHEKGIDGYGNPGQALFKFDPAAANPSGGMRVAFVDPLRISAAAQFRVTEGANNPGSASASISYNETPVTGLRSPVDLTTLANGAYSTAVRNINVSLSSPVGGVATIAHGMKDVSIYLNAPQPGQELTVMTKDGRQLIGRSMAGNSDLQGQLIRTDNGFAAGASYSDAYLNGARQSVALSGVATGAQSFLGVAVAGSASGNTPAQLAAKIVANKTDIMSGSQAISAGVSDIQIDPNDNTKLIIVSHQTSPPRSVFPYLENGGIKFGTGMDLNYKAMSVFYGAQATVQLQPTYNEKDQVSGQKAFSALLQGGRMQPSSTGIAANTLVLNGVALDALPSPESGNTLGPAEVAAWFNGQTAKTGVTASASNEILLNESEIKYGLPLSINGISIINGTEVHRTDDSDASVRGRLAGFAANINSAVGSTVTARVTAQGQLLITGKPGYETADITISSGVNIGTNALGLTAGTYRGQVSLSRPTAELPIVTAANDNSPGIDFSKPLFINGKEITTAGLTSNLQLAQAINNATPDTKVTARVSASGQLFLSNLAGHEDADLYISASSDMTPKEGLAEVNALGVTGPVITVEEYVDNQEDASGPATLVSVQRHGPIKLADQAINHAPIQLGFGSNGTPTDLAKLGFRTGAFIAGEAKDDLLVFVTGAGQTSISASYAGQAVDAKQTLRAQSLRVTFQNETDPSNPNKTLSYTITSTDPQTQLSTVVAKRFFDNEKLNPGIAFQGLELTFTAPPQHGDVFAMDGNTDGIGSNDNMIALVGLEKKALIGNKTLGNAYVDHVNEMGNVARQASIAQTALSVVHDQAIKSRDQISGVSLDREAADLIRYQQAYQASAKALQVASQLFETVLQVR